MLLGTEISSISHWLAAIRAPRLGGKKLIRLTESFGGIDGVFGAGDQALREWGLDARTIDYLHRPETELIEADLRWLQGPDHHLVTWGDDDYPDLLSRIPSPPAALFVAGDLNTLYQPQIAVVGSRNPSSGGMDNARDFAGELARRGFVVTSGLASGIDSACHDAAMDAQSRTIAVVGTGPDRVYPASSRQRAVRIVQNGAMVTEFPPGTQARRQNFPARNRMISGLSLGVLVIEAGLNSGSLITARLGSEQGREVFALPGSIHNPMAKGCHRLIREGARLVETVDEIIEGIMPMAGELASSLTARLSAASAGSVENANAGPKMTGDESTQEDSLQSYLRESDPDYKKLMDKIGFDPKPVDSLIEQTGLTAREVSAMLLILELRGAVEAHPGGAFSRKLQLAENNGADKK